jgi:hypothetical protein
MTKFGDFAFAFDSSLFLPDTQEMADATSLARGNVEAGNHFRDLERVEAYESEQQLFLVSLVSSSKICQLWQKDAAVCTRSE